MEHGRTLERLDAFKSKQQQQQMMQQQQQIMQQQEQHQIRDLHKESLHQILSLEERIRQLEMQEFQAAEEQMPTTTIATKKTTTIKSLTDQQKSGARGGGGKGVSAKATGDSRKRDEVALSTK